MARISQTHNPEPKVEDEFLIALAKQGDRNAYDRLVRRYYGFVRLKASSYFLAGGDSEDLIQEGLVGLYKAIRDFRNDRESSFRNFAELCITRQIITAVKTATRNKHSPLNQYVSFSSTPAGSGDEVADARPDAPGADRPRPGQPGDLLRGAALARGVPVLSPVGAREPGAVAVPRRLLLRAGRRAPLLRHQDGRQRPSACQAQGRRPPAVTGGGRLRPPGLLPAAVPAGRSAGRRPGRASLRSRTGRSRRPRCPGRREP